MRYWIWLLFLCATGFAYEESFVVIEDSQILREEGQYVHEQVTPCSTFKIALSLIGFDSGVLKDQSYPVWDFQEGYDDFLPVWKKSQTPQSWIKYSCIWYSKVLTSKLGLDRLQNYLEKLGYGNQDISGGLKQAWVNSSLKISPIEQVQFLQKMLRGSLAVSQHAVDVTKDILFIETLGRDWKLYGKTGWSGPRGIHQEIGWFVGWVENDERILPFAYQMRGKPIALNDRILRAQQLLAPIINK